MRTVEVKRKKTGCIEQTGMLQERWCEDRVGQTQNVATLGAYVISEMTMMMMRGRRRRKRKRGERKPQKRRRKKNSRRRRLKRRRRRRRRLQRRRKGRRRRLKRRRSHREGGGGENMKQRTTNLVGFSLILVIKGNRTSCSCSLFICCTIISLALK